MTQRHEPEDDRDIPIVTVTLDMAEFDALRIHIRKAAELAHNIAERHSLGMSGVDFALEACVQADLRIAVRDAEMMVKRVTQ